MDHKAFAREVALHQPAVSRYVARTLRRREDAEELVQEAFLRAWAQIDRFRPGSNFGAWVMTIARFLVMSRLKEEKRRPAPAALDRLPPPAAPEALPPDLERLRLACDELPAAQREVLALRFFDGLDYRAIARITGDSEVALRSRLHDALQRLRGMLNPAPRKS